MPQCRAPRAVLLACVVALAAAITPVTTAAAQEAGTQVLSPGLVYETAAGGDHTLAGLAGSVAPPNTDFALVFGPGVDADVAAAVSAAAGIWSSVIDVTVPIEVAVEWVGMDPGLLGAAGPTSAFFGRADFPEPDVLYPVALANQLAGRDLDPGAPDIELVLASTITWDRSLDGSGSGQSLLSVALHELGHGLGLTSWVRRSDTGHEITFAVGGASVALAYDRQLTDAQGRRLVDLDATRLGTALTTSVRWAGTAGLTAAGGPIALYAPTVFSLGSSIGHLDESAFGPELMTPFLGRGETHLTISPVTRGMLTDIGWAVAATPTPASDPVEAGATPLGDTEAFVTAVTTDFLGRAPTASELSRWSDHVDSGGDRATVARSFAYSDEWLGVLVDDLYRSTLGRDADADGRAFWIGVLRSGQTPASVAASFYASEEYHRRAGTDSAWVADLYAEILGRAADPGGLAFWTMRTAEVGRNTVASDFYQSLESRRDRVADLFQTLLGRAPEPGGWAYWAEVLTDGRDVDLAVDLASSSEYAQRARVRFATR